MEVSKEESGQKLVQFLLRRITLPTALLHRWIRQGQIRLNGHRVKPFAHVNCGDIVRLPPFAFKVAEDFAKENVSPGLDNEKVLTLHQLPPIVASFSDLVVFNKPAGLSTHGGTGQSISLAAILAEHFADAKFRPTPIHRLDKDTSGLIMVAMSYTALRHFQDAFLKRTITKEYLALVEGQWGHNKPVVLKHQIEKKDVDGKEKMYIGAGKEAVSQVVGIKLAEKASLLQIKILTGRTHQIRAQLAYEGHPLCGDIKYGAKKPAGLFLHAARIVLPDSTKIEVLPPWNAALNVDVLPPPIDL